jgi:hypothetical protein
MKDHSEKARGGRSTGEVSSAEREVVLERLNRACGEGLLSLREYSERVEDAQLARTRAELDRLVDGLPEVGEAPDVRTEWHVTAMGGLRRHGRWLMDRHLVSVSVVGGANLDLREAALGAPEVTLTKVSLLGGVTVCVPRGVRVVLESRSLFGGAGLLSGRRLLGGLGLFGGRDDCEEEAADAPTVRVRAFSLLGGVTVNEPPLRRSA